MEPDLVIHKYPCNKFGGFNEIDNKFLLPTKNLYLSQEGRYTKYRFPLYSFID